MGDVDELLGIKDLGLLVEVLVAQHRLHSVQAAVGWVADPLVGVCKAEAEGLDECVQVFGRVVLHLCHVANLSLSTERVNGLKEDVSYFVESNSVRRVSLAYRVADTNSKRRKRTSTRTKASTMNSTSTKRKRSSV